MWDLRIEIIFQEEMKGDTSFTEKIAPLGMLFGTHKFNQIDMRETWHRGIKYGIEIGLRRASLNGQRIETFKNIENDRQREFYEKFLKLSDEYNCAIYYHPIKGMQVIDRTN